jgi:hypothetical protein
VNIADEPFNIVWTATIPEVSLRESTAVVG